LHHFRCKKLRADLKCVNHFQTTVKAGRSTAPGLPDQCPTTTYFQTVNPLVVHCTRRKQLFARLLSDIVTAIDAGDLVAPTLFDPQPSQPSIDLTLYLPPLIQPLLGVCGKPTIYSIRFRKIRTDRNCVQSAIQIKSDKNNYLHSLCR